MPPFSIRFMPIIASDGEGQPCRTWERKKPQPRALLHSAGANMKNHLPTTHKVLSRQIPQMFMQKKKKKIKAFFPLVLF